MFWNEVRITTTSIATDAISNMLSEIGAQGVTIEDPQDILVEIKRQGSLDYADDNFINSLGEDAVIKAYFSSLEEIDDKLKEVKVNLDHISRFLDIGKALISVSQVNDEDWSTSWKKYYKPFKLSDRVVIKPSWEPYDAQKGDVVIEMDPGMAFGTGTHETTKMCSILIEKYIKGNEFIYDIGTGSGILSIIAAKLGARSVKAIDIDQVAVQVARKNCELNDTLDIVDVEVGVIEDLDDKKVDVVVANIIADIIIDISKEMKMRLKSNGIAILSGIIKERIKEVEDAYCSLGFEIEERMEMGEWVALVVKCQDIS